MVIDAHHHFWKYKKKIQFELKGIKQEIKLNY